MGKLKRLIRKSKVMDISIDYNGEKINFNLHQELRVNEDIINEQLKDQPTHYGFLLMLRARLISKLAQAKKDKSERHSELWQEYREETNPITGRAYTKEDILAIIDNDEEYTELYDTVIKLSEEVDILDAAVNSFEQRSYLLQTLSANTRKQV